MPADTSSTSPQASSHTQIRDFLALHLLPGVGPKLSRRLLDRFHTPQRILQASAAELSQIHGIGPATAAQLHQAAPEALAAAERELAQCDDFGVRILVRGSPDYPEILAPLPDAPLLLYVKGQLPPAYRVAIVGSRACTAYGLEQAERFAMAFTQAGLTVVSGGARGIDTAGHRAAVTMGGPTIAVLGCGLACCYPPENAELFQQIITHGGCLISELPISTAPAPENFPGRNRIISGLSLGVLVIEAPEGSGALITARHAADEQGREVMAVPGRIDSPASEGSNNLIRNGAALVTSPQEVIEILEPQAHHAFQGTHAVRYHGYELPFEDGHPVAAETDKPAMSVPPPPPPPSPSPSPPPPSPTPAANGPRLSALNLSDTQTAILNALDGGATYDQIIRRTRLDPGPVNAELTMLELRGLLRRTGSLFLPPKPGK